MTFGITVLVASAVLLALSMLTPMVNPFFRKVGSGDDEEGDADAEKLPKLSVVVTAQDDAMNLGDCLQAILSQQYSQDFEVIVVMSQGDMVAKEMVERFGSDSRVYTTFVPPRSLFMSKEKLAVTLGVKAAHYEWVMLVSSDCIPQTERWLALMARHCQEGTDMVMGYANYADDAPSFYRFYRLRTAMYLMRAAQRGTAYRSDNANILFRKKMFIDDDGYRGNLQFLHGEYDFIVNKYATKGNTAVETSPEAHLVEATPTRKAWHNKAIAGKHLRKHLRGAVRMRLLSGLDTSFMYLDYAAIVAAIVVSCIMCEWLLLAVAIVSLAITIALRMVFAASAASFFQEKVPLWKFIPFEMSLPWRNIYYIIRYRASDKRDFTTHKI